MNSNIFSLKLCLCQNDIKNVQNTLFAVQVQQRKCVAPPSRYVLDRSNPTAFADEFNTIFP